MYVFISVSLGISLCVCVCVALGEILCHERESERESLVCVLILQSC